MKAQLIEVARIWDNAPHCAFTGLVRFQEYWYCTFREAQKHVSPDGKLRIIRSRDGKQWESVALIPSTDSDLPDLRDPKIGIIPDGRLMLMGCATSLEEGVPRRTYVWFSVDGKEWSDKHPVGDPGTWLWSFTSDEKVLFGVGYEKNNGVRSVSLYRAENPPAFERLTTLHTDERFPNETSLLMEGDSGIALIRREFAPGQTTVPPYNNGTALLGVSRAPFTDWQTTDLGIYVGGPTLLRLPNGKIIAAGRQISSAHYATLWELDTEKGALHELLILPSGGDCSYPGLVWHEDHLWISYYSHHEGAAKIYFAKVQIVD